MKNRYVFVILFSLISSQSWSSELTSRDSNHTVAHPRHELYIQFFNPLDLLNIAEFAHFNAEFSWNRKENRYFTFGIRHIHDTSIDVRYPLFNSIQYQQVSFCHMHRYQTVKKWLSLEFDYGIFAGRRFSERIDELEDLTVSETFGAGLTSSFEIQFNIGNWGNISLDTEMAVLFGKSNYYFVGPEIESEFDAWPGLWAFRPGVTFYF